MPLRADDVANAAFSRPLGGRRGYGANEVDKLLGRVVDALDGHADRALIAELRGRRLATTRFRRAYDADQVDALLDLCRYELENRAAQEERAVDEG